MRLGYNTNGFAHHRLEDAIEILADLGYGAVAITLDHHALNPFDPAHRDQLVRVRRQLERRDLTCVVETGARFLLDARRKHQPTLLDPDPSQRERRRAFLSAAIVIARELGSKVVSFWSGATPKENTLRQHEDSELLSELANECRRLCDEADRAGVNLAFEPEPGMFIDTMDRFRALHDRVDHPRFGLTLDIGHVHCLQDGRVEQHVTAWRDKLFNVHLEDMRAGLHDHLMFGEGEMDFAPVFAALRDIKHSGPACVELSRHSHDAVRAATAAYRFLHPLI